MLGLQWQPEYLSEMRRVFEAFVRAAADYRMKKLEMEKLEVDAELREGGLTGGERDENRHTLETSDSPPDTSQT